jgi:hypothetical protein
VDEVSRLRQEKSKLMEASNALRSALVKVIFVCPFYFHKTSQNKPETLRTIEHGFSPYHLPRYSTNSRTTSTTTPRSKVGTPLRTSTTNRRSSMTLPDTASAAPVGVGASALKVQAGQEVRKAPVAPPRVAATVVRIGMAEKDWDWGRRI